MWMGGGGGRGVRSALDIRLYFLRAAFPSCRISTDAKTSFFFLLDVAGGRSGGGVNNPAHESSDGERGRVFVFPRGAFKAVGST